MKEPERLLLAGVALGGTQAYVLDRWDSPIAMPAMVLMTVSVVVLTARWLRPLPGWWDE